MDSAKECESKFAFQQSGLFREFARARLSLQGYLKLQRIKMHTTDSRRNGDRSSSQSQERAKGEGKGVGVGWKNQHRSIALNMNGDGLRERMRKQICISTKWIIQGIRKDQVPAARYIKLQRIKMHTADGGQGRHCFQRCLWNILGVFFGFGTKGVGL
ncbi:hypothetical protein CDAR_305951 [Caerostris darwini]|uniref:Uncharacterized protein n=1 Tax=Caerostris darwini TaxID=1538125 RepID=A0AAV4VTC8_9ARAC|nr:hypothetical protein CDAR_305951 [Caerostris darwini]